MSETLMNYTVDPTRFQVGSTSATLQVVASAKKTKVDESTNPWDPPLQHDDVYLHEIIIDIGVDGTVSDLTGNPVDITVSQPTGWRKIGNKWKFGALSDWKFSHTPNTGGTFVAKPKTPIKVDKDTVIHLVLSNITINRSPTSTITITEQASLGSATAALQKTPQPGELHCFEEFQVGQLCADNNYIEYDGSVMLSWAGSEGAEYSLHWMQDNEVKTIPRLPHSSSLITPTTPDNGLIVDDLKDKSVTFELKTDPEPKGHHPNTCTVFVRQREPKFYGFEVNMEDSGKLLVKWKTEHFESIEIIYGPKNLVLSTSGAPSGSVEFELSSSNPSPLNFTLRAKRPNVDEPDLWMLENTLADVQGSPIKFENYGVIMINPSPDGLRLYVSLEKIPDDAGTNGSSFGEIRVLYTQTLHPVTDSPNRIEKGLEIVMPMLMSPDSSRYYTIGTELLSVDTYINIIDCKTLKPAVGRLLVTEGENLAISSNGEWLYVADMGHITVPDFPNEIARAPSIHVYDTKTLGEIPGLNNKQDLSPGKIVVSSGENPRVFFYDILEGKFAILNAETLEHVAGSPISMTTEISDFLVSPDGSRLYTGANDWSVVHAYDTLTLKLLVESEPSYRTPHLSISDDGAVLFVSTGDHQLTALDAETLRPLTVPRQLKQVRGVATAPGYLMRVYVAVDGAKAVGVLTSKYVQSATWGPK